MHKDVRKCLNFHGTQIALSGHSGSWTSWQIQPFPSGRFSVFFACKPPLMNLEYFVFRWVATLGLHFISVKCDLSYFLEEEKTYQHQGRVNGKYCAHCTQICVTHITVGCKRSTLMVWNKLSAFNWSADIYFTVSQLLSCAFQATGHISNPYFSHLSHFCNEWMKCLCHSQVGLLVFWFFGVFFQTNDDREWNIFNAICKNNIHANNNISESWSSI